MQMRLAEHGPSPEQGRQATPGRTWLPWRGLPVARARHRRRAGTRRRFEGALGADLSGVRVRTGRDVDEVSDKLQAHVFTVGSDVYVRRADYRPGTRAGDALRARADACHPAGIR